MAPDAERSNKQGSAFQAFQDKVAKFITNKDSPRSPSGRDFEPWPRTHQREPRAYIPSRSFSVVIHVVLFCMFVGTFLYNIGWDISRHRIIIDDWIYLTHWNLTFQVIFCTLELISDFNSSFAERSSSFRAKLYHTIVAPFGLFIFAFFWGLCLIDEDLVRPKKQEDRCEDWYNHMVVSDGQLCKKHLS